MLIKDEPNPISFVNRTPNITTRGCNQHHVQQTPFAQTYIRNACLEKNIRNSVSPNSIHIPIQKKKGKPEKKCSLTPKAAVLHKYG